MLTAAVQPENSPSAPDPLRHSLANAAHYWEPRRILYNLLLTAVALIWIVVSWPHFRPAFNLPSLLPILVLALLANFCYCAAYFIDVPVQHSAIAASWRRWRWLLWLLGTLFAIFLENYWIADEIYPFVR